MDMGLSKWTNSTLCTGGSDLYARKKYCTDGADSCHRRSWCGAALTQTSQCDSPTRGTSRDLRDYLSIFCGSHHASITISSSPYQHVDIMPPLALHNIIKAAFQCSPSGHRETRIIIDQKPTNESLSPWLSKLNGQVLCSL